MPEEALDRQETLCVLRTPDTVIPLSWVHWQWGKHVICRLLNPDDRALQQVLLGAQCARMAYPCLLKDPIRQQWHHCDAYLTEVKAHPVFEVTLVPTGAMRVSDASPYTPLPMGRRKRRDAGQPRKRKAVPVEP